MEEVLKFESSKVLKLKWRSAVMLEYESAPFGKLRPGELLASGKATPLLAAEEQSEYSTQRRG